jgi:ADP-dependent NAD(P)H-hydrate dehydratase / NAD(P)H-hydrate epimerase
VGLRPPLPQPVAALLALVQAARPRVALWALDLPSGLVADEPTHLGLYQADHVQADHTVVLSGYKSVHLFSPARERCGRLWLAGGERVGIAPALAAAYAWGQLATAASVRSLLPWRNGNAHKGNAGRLLLLAGAAQYPGAPALAAWGALRAGAGLIALATADNVALQPPLEATRLGVTDWSGQQVARVLNERSDAIAAGMGMSGVDLAGVQLLLAQARPLLLDAECLQPQLATLLRPRQHPTVLTPHPGEAARLLGCSVAEMTANPANSALRLAQGFAATIVLKGGPTVVAEYHDNGHKLWVNSTGNPGMAVGGMGDVLSGVIAALLAQGLDGWDAARLGVYLHGLAGDLAYQRLHYGLGALDVAQAVAEAWRLLATDDGP